MRVLTWNLFHGRAVPPAGRELLSEFRAALAQWPWDVALLQEVPPWWPAALEGSLEAEGRSVLTSRNSLLPARRAIARRWPDAIKSNGGGADAILVRDGPIAEHRSRRLSLLPERRRLHAVRLGEVWVGNLHTEASLDQAELAARTLLNWAGDAPALLGGDFNLRSFTLPAFQWVGGHSVDHVFAHGLRGLGAPQVLERGPLSDHAPVLVEVG